MYLRQNSTICYELSRATYGHFTSFLRIVTSILRNVTIHRSFYVLVTTRLRVVTNSYKKYINPANLNVSLFDNKSYKKSLRIIYGFLRAVYVWLCVVASGL